MFRFLSIQKLKDFNKNLLEIIFSSVTYFNSIPSDRFMIIENIGLYHIILCTL